jgi:hypothetical protein
MQYSKDSSILGDYMWVLKRFHEELFICATSGNLLSAAGKLFRWLCSKEIEVNDIPFWEGEAVEILCHMEMHLPPSLFDIQFHLMVHLPGEVRLCGPMPPRWMYFVERYMAELKGWIRQRAQPKGFMIQGYLVAETMHYISEYSERFHPCGPKLINFQGHDKFNGIVLPKSRVSKVMSPVFREQAWRFLLLNNACLDSWREIHASAEEADSNIPSFTEWLLPALTASVEESGQRPDQMVWDLAVGPSASADLFTAYWAYGRHFRIASRDLSKKTTFDCGISQWFDIDGEEREFNGYVDAIVRLNFDSFETVLIKAKWYNSNHSNERSCMLLEDECGHLRVKVVDFLPDDSPSDEPFAFPKDLDQLFFVDDWLHRGWKLAVKVQPRTSKVCYQSSRPTATENHAEGESSTETDQNLFESTSVGHLSRPVSTEVGGTASDDLHLEDSDKDRRSEEDEGWHSKSDRNGDLVERRWTANDGLDSLLDEEWMELESDGEMEERPSGNPRQRLDSAT